MAVATTNEPNSGGLPASPVNPEVNKQPDSNQKQSEINKPTTNLTLADITNPFVGILSSYNFFKMLSGN